MVKRTTGPEIEFDGKEPKRTKTTTEAVARNSIDLTDVDNFFRGTCNLSSLEPVGDENVPKQARVARNVRIRGAK